MILPPQKLPMSQKTIRHDKTGKNNIEETIDYYISCANWTTQTQEIANLYKAVEGFLDESEYDLIQNPYNKQKDAGAPSLYNAKLKNYNILKGIANLLIGEFGRRAHEYVVSSVSPSDEFSYKDGLALVLKNYYAQQIANTLQEIGLEVGQQVQELPPLEEYVQKFKDKFDETRILTGQDILDYIVYNCDLDSKYIDLFWDWIITGRFFTYKKVNHDDVYFEAVPVHEIYSPRETHSRFVEDNSFAVRRQVLPMYKIVDLFRGRLDEDIIDAMEGRMQDSLGFATTNVQITGRNGLIQMPTMYADTSSPFKTINDSVQGVELFHVTYKTFRDYQVLTYLDKFGTERLMEVGGDYKLNKAQGDISLKREWENITYEGYRCLDFYIDCQPLPESRADLNQEGLQKLPYNGTYMRSSTGEVQSIIKDGLNHQRLINVLHYQLEKLINKNKDKLLIMPYELVPRKKGMNTKDQMYHADATSILWVDGTVPGAANAAQMIKTVDLSLGNYMRETIDLIKFIKSDYWESIGMNAQRYADVGQNAGKAVTEQAIVRSAIITYDLTRQFEKVQEKDYQGLVDISKLAYIKGKKAKYIRTDGSLAFLEMNPDDAVNHSEASYGVFVKDSSTMTEGVQAIRQQILPMIQNGSSPEVAGEVWKTNNVTRLTKILKKVDANKKEYEQLVAKQAQEAQAQLQESINANDEKNRAMEKYKIDSEYQKAIDVATLKVNDISPETPVNKEANDTEKLLANHKIQKENTALALQNKAIEVNKQKINTNNKKN
jgi:hypothetical protein